jgi:hypothetical protein
MKTLNQLIKVFEDFSENHGQVHSFGVGDIWEAGMSNSLQYPTVWVQPTESRAIKGASGYAITNTKFRVFILDRVKKDETNESEVLSDTTQIAHDLIKNIDSNPVFLTGEGYTFNEEDIIMEYVTEKLKDEVSGVYLQMTFTTPFNQGCSTPLNS